MLKVLIGDFMASGQPPSPESCKRYMMKTRMLPGDGVEAAQKAVSDAMSAARAVQADVEALVNAVETAKSFYAKVEDGTYVLSTAGKEALAQGIAEAEKALKETSMSAMQEQASAHTGKLAAQVENAELWRG